MKYEGLPAATLEFDNAHLLAAAACLMASFVAGGIALAQHAGTQREQAACTRDASRFCRMDLGDDGAVQQCLQINCAHLSRTCKKVFESHGM